MITDGRWDTAKSKVATALVKSKSSITQVSVIQKYTREEIVIAGDARGTLSIWDFKNSVRLAAI